MKFKYHAKASSGADVKGEIEAVSVNGAAQSLREQGLVPVGIHEKVSGLSFKGLNEMFGKVTQTELANFTRQLSTMITAGLPLTDTLNILKSQSGPIMSRVVGEILLDVQSGVSLSSAMAKHPKVFSKVYVALVKAGEAAGIMETILNRLAEESEKNREFAGKVKGAMVYPFIILIGMIGVMIIMMVVVVPKLTAIYDDFGADLPVATKMIIALSDFFTNPITATIMVVGVVGVVFIVRGYFQTTVGRTTLDKVIYKIPIMGPLAQQVMLTELTGTLGLLVGAGVSIVEALNIVSDALGNIVVEQSVKKIAKQVEKGFPVSISFSESPVFPPLIGQMVAVGEETGKMDDVLLKLTHFFGSEAEQKVKALTTAIEPLIIILLAVGVGFLMYAIVMPLYGITNKF